MVKQTANILTGIIKSKEWDDAKQLFKLIKSVGHILIGADPLAFYIGNTIKRVLHIIREECKTLGFDLKHSTAKSNIARFSNPG